MDDPVSRFLEATRQFGARVHAVREDQWSAPTPDSEWNVAQLVEHLVDEHRWMPPLLHGLDLESAGKVVEGTRNLPVDGGVGANLAQEWDEAATASADACRAPGVLEQAVALSRGATPAGEYIGEMTLDAVVHAWDLGKAIGFEGSFPDDLVSWAWDAFKNAGDLSGTGLFAAPVEVADDAPLIDRLVAATGRTP